MWKCENVEMKAVGSRRRSVRPQANVEMWQFENLKMKRSVQNEITFTSNTLRPAPLTLSIPLPP